MMVPIVVSCDRFGCFTMLLLCEDLINLNLEYVKSSEYKSISTGGIGNGGNKAPNTLITTVQFDGSNFHPWFHSV